MNDNQLGWVVRVAVVAMAVCFAAWWLEDLWNPPAYIYPTEQIQAGWICKGIGVRSTDYADVNSTLVVCLDGTTRLVTRKELD